MTRRRPSPLFIVCNGGYRTGSTVAYNIVRGILALRDIEHTSGLRSDPTEIDAAMVEFAQSPAWVVLKSHVWAPTTPQPWIRVIYTTRDYFDVAASLRRHRDNWETVQADLQRQAETDALHRSPDFVEAHRPLLLEYDYYYAHPRQRVDMIGRHIGLNLPPHEIARVLTRTSLDRAVAIQSGLAEYEQDPETLIQAGHIGQHGGRPGQGRTLLGSEGVERVEAALAAVAI